MKHFLILLSLLTATLAFGQTSLRPIVTFGGTEQNNWTASGIASTTIDGTASGTPNWTSRPGIASVSGEEALLLEGNSARFLSPMMDFQEQTEVFLSFHQYYRNFRGATSIEVIEGGAVLAVFSINTTLAEGVETAPYDTVLLDLTALLAGTADRQVAFNYSGQSYFWLLDDIAFYGSPPLPKTRPLTLGRYLGEEGYPYRVDTAGGAYVPQQLVVQYEGGTSPDTMLAIREELGAKLIDSCACGALELWEIDGSRIVGQGEFREDSTGTIDLLSLGRGAKRKSKIDGVDLNTYNLTQPLSQDTLNIADLTADSLSGLGPSKPNALRIAIIDTGIDYHHPSVSDFVRLRADGIGNGIDDDGNCLDDDPIGWNFVANNNNPFDDNEHGTHVASILADTLSKYRDRNTSFEFVAYKTHDHNGVSTLFNVACATFQAVQDDVDLINDSWGFFGDSSTILGNAIDTAATRDIVVISASGNDSLLLDTLLQFPACYLAPNVIAVGATGTAVGPDGVPVFSNLSESLVDVLAPGYEVLGAIPNNHFSKKTGTSMATPMVAAAVAQMAACLRNGPDNRRSYKLIRDRTLARMETVPAYSRFVDGGRFLRYYPDCPAVVSTGDGQVGDPGFRVFPNPVHDQLQVVSETDQRDLSLVVYDLSGRRIAGKTLGVWRGGTTQTLALPDLPAGMYVLQIRGQSMSWSGKILKL